MPVRGENGYACTTVDNRFPYQSGDILRRKLSVRVQAGGAHSRSRRDTRTSAGTNSQELDERLL